jgi:hypothetical protein
VRDLAERMDAGVGAAGAMDRGPLPCKGGDGVRENAPLSCICQPTNGVPSYSMVSL